MGSVVFTSASGWGLVVLLAATIALPYLIRSRLFALQDESPVSWRTRLHPTIGWDTSVPALCWPTPGCQCVQDGPCGAMPRVCI